MNDLYYEPAIAKFKLPLPPTSNHSYTPAVVGGNSTIISKKEHKQYIQDAAILLNNQHQLMNNTDRNAYERIIRQIKKDNVFIFIDVLFFLENILQRDEDGGLKVVQDVVCDHIGINDKYVIDAHPGKRQAHGNPRCEIAVYIANQENAL